MLSSSHTHSATAVPPVHMHWRVCVRLFAPHHSLNTSLKEYSVLVIQYSQLYTNSSRTHIYSISYSISTNISYPLSSLSFSLLPPLSSLSFSLLPFHRRAHRNLARGERDAWFSVLLYRPEPYRLIYRRAVQECTCYIWRPVGFAGARCAQPDDDSFWPNSGCVRYIHHHPCIWIGSLLVFVLAAACLNDACMGRGGVHMPPEDCMPRHALQRALASVVVRVVLTSRLASGRHRVSQILSVSVCSSIEWSIS
jgi:hypothetical protein